MGINVGNNHFQVVEENPNPNGKCLFSMRGDGRHENCHGPYVQFNAIAAPTSEDELHEGRAIIQAVACLSGLMEAVIDARQLLASGQIEEKPLDGLSQQEKMEAQPAATAEFSSLPQDEQDRLISSFGPGETFRMPDGNVYVTPGQRAKRLVVQNEPLSAPSPFSVVDVSGHALDDLGEVPGRKPGTFEPVEVPEDDILAEAASE